jgi:hypothetical protein
MFEGRTGVVEALGSGGALQDKKWASSSLATDWRTSFKELIGQNKVCLAQLLGFAACPAASHVKLELQAMKRTDFVRTSKDQRNRNICPEIQDRNKTSKTEG